MRFTSPAGLQHGSIAWLLTSNTNAQKMRWFNLTDVNMLRQKNE